MPSVSSLTSREIIVMEAGSENPFSTALLGKEVAERDNRNANPGSTNKKDENHSFTEPRRFVIEPLVWLFEDRFRARRRR